MKKVKGEHFQRTALYSVRVFDGLALRATVCDEVHQFTMEDIVGYYARSSDSPENQCHLVKQFGGKPSGEYWLLKPHYPRGVPPENMFIIVRR